MQKQLPFRIPIFHSAFANGPYLVPQYNRTAVPLNSTTQTVPRTHLREPRRTSASDAFAELNASECLRFIRICGHNLVVRSGIVNIHSADAYDRR